MGEVRRVLGAAPIFLGSCSVFKKSFGLGVDGGLTMLIPWVAPSAHFCFLESPPRGPNRAMRAMTRLFVHDVFFLN